MTAHPGSIRLTTLPDLRALGVVPGVQVRITYRRKPGDSGSGHPLEDGGRRDRTGIVEDVHPGWAGVRVDQGYRITISAADIATRLARIEVLAGKEEDMNLIRIEREPEEIFDPPAAAQNVVQPDHQEPQSPPGPAYEKTEEPAKVVQAAVQEKQEVKPGKSPTRLDIAREKITKEQYLAHKTDGKSETWVWQHYSIASDVFARLKKEWGLPCLPSASVPPGGESRLDKARKSLSAELYKALRSDGFIDSQIRTRCCVAPDVLVSLKHEWGLIGWTPGEEPALEPVTQGEPVPPADSTMGAPGGDDIDAALTPPIERPATMEGYVAEQEGDRCPVPDGEAIARTDGWVKRAFWVPPDWGMPLTEPEPSSEWPSLPSLQYAINAITQVVMERVSALIDAKLGYLKGEVEVANRLDEMDKRIADKCTAEWGLEVVKRIEDLHQTFEMIKAIVGDLNRAFDRHRHQVGPGHFSDRPDNIERG